MSGSVYTFTDGHIVIKLNDREIYNDIRSQIDITLTPVVIDTPAVYGYDTPLWKATPPDFSIFNLGIGASKTVVIPTLNERSAISWSGAYAYAYGDSCSATILSSDSGSATVEVANTDAKIIIVAFVSATYQYLKTGATSNTTTGSQTLTVLTSDAASIQKYGRRTFDMQWPQGQTQAEMETLSEAYCSKHCEPVPTAVYTVLGKTVALVEQIFTRRISDLITIQQPDIGLDADFFINSVSIGNSGGLVKATWGLEMAREAGNN